MLIENYFAKYIYQVAGRFEYMKVIQVFRDTPKMSALCFCISALRQQTVPYAV